MTAMSPTVLVVGSLHYDMMVAASRLPRLGETLPGSAWAAKCGGKGGNQAMEAARHGARTAIIGCIGPDEMGARLRDNLSRGGVDVAHVRTAKIGSGLSVVISEAAGDYAAVIVSGANECLDEGDLAAAEALLSAAGVVVLQNEIPDAVNQTAALRGRAAGARIVWNAAPARPSDALLALVDVLVVNAVEAEMLGAGAVTDLASAEAAALELGRRVPVAIVTAGGDGVAWCVMDAVDRVEPHRVDLVSTHGAGDAFIGALAARLAHGAAMSDAISYANAAAAALVSTPEADRPTLTSATARRILRSPATG